MRISDRAILIIASSLFGALLATTLPATAADTDPYFLVATRDLPDPIFAQTVIFVMPAVKEAGLVVGLIVNKPSKVLVKDLISGAATLGKPAQTAFFGGPVDFNTPSLLVRAPQPLVKSIHIFEDVYLVTDPDMVNGYIKAPPDVRGVRLIVGRAQWSPDQLAGEISEGSWYKAPASVNTVFSADPAKVWPALVERGSMQEVRADPGRIRHGLQFVALRAAFDVPLLPIGAAQGSGTVAHFWPPSDPQ